MCKRWRGIPAFRPHSGTSKAMPRRVVGLLILSDVLHIYTRVSTLVQADEGMSLEFQKELGIKRAQQLGFEYKLWNEGGRSSNHEEIDKRPVLSQLFNEIKRGAVKHLFVYDQSRLSRHDTVSSIFRIECAKQGVTLYNKEGKYDLSDPNDHLMKQILDAIGQFDNAQRAERTRLGKIAKVRQGYWLGGPPPYGYKIENHRLVINEDEARWVRHIFEQYANKVPLIDTKVELDINGVLPRRQRGTWTLGSLQAMLRNTHYIGYWEFKDGKSGELIRNECERILPSELWLRVKSTREDHAANRNATNPTRHFYLLKGMIKCGHCGTLLGGVTSQSGKQKKHFYYCTKKERQWSKERIPQEEKWKRGRVCSMTRSLDIDATDQLVWDAVMQAVTDSVLLKEAVRKSSLAVAGDAGAMSAKDRKAMEAKIKSLKKHIAKLDDGLTDLEGERLMGRISPSQYPVIKDKISLEKVGLEGQIETLEGKLLGMDQRKQWIDWIKHFQLEIKRYKDGTPEQKRELLQGLLTQIDVHLIDSRTHRLDIQFKLPIVGDALQYKDPTKKSKGYTLQNGCHTLPVESTARRYAKKNV